MRLIEGARVYRQGGWNREDFSLPAPLKAPVTPENCIVVPGFVDVHVHLREPGFSHKETIRTGTAAAARGGYTILGAMPNLDPTPDTLAHLRPQLEIIARDAIVRVIPYGTLTMDRAGRETAALEETAPFVIGYSDDGSGVQDRQVMRTAMLRAKALGKIVAAHCEANDLLRGGYIHDGSYARLHGHKGICSESEWGQIARDLELVRETGCSYHVCHVSAAESVELIRRAKAEGLDVSCETAPHYLLLNDMDLQEDGRFKMNPPIRSERDRLALIEGVLDGTIDMIATDHAPHTAAEKSRGLADSAMGVVGLETAFPALYTGLVETGILSLEKLIGLMSDTPRRRFGIPPGNDWTVIDLSREWTVDPDDFASMGRATPFAGRRVRGRVIMTIMDGKTVYSE